MGFLRSEMRWCVCLRATVMIGKRPSKSHKSQDGSFFFIILFRLKTQKTVVASAVRKKHHIPEWPGIIHQWRILNEKKDRCRRMWDFWKASRNISIDSSGSVPLQLYEWNRCGRKTNLRKKRTKQKQFAVQTTLPSLRSTHSWQFIKCTFRVP